MHIPEPLERLIQELAKLPGIGRKTAQRLALGILRYDAQEITDLAEALLEIPVKIRYCSVCFGFTESDPCAICRNPQRNQKIICVVEQPNNIFSIEKSRVFQGTYHVLMGAISPLEGIGPAQLKLRELQMRIAQGTVEELILATNPSVQGEATALFLQQTFGGKIPKITRLARGLPAGGDLEYVDDVTLTEAFSGRQRF